MLDPRIEAYIRQHRRRYTREALTKQLEDAGHDRAAIEATWAALDAPDPDELAGEGFWGRFWLVLVGINVAVFVLVALVTGMIGGLAEGGGIVLAIFAVVLAIGALIAWAIVVAVGPTKLGRTTATIVGVAIPALFALLIGGTCYAMVGFSGSPAPTGSLDLRLEPPRELQASGSATCFGARGQAGFSVMAEIEADGQIVFVSIDSFTAELGPGVAPPGPTSPADGTQTSLYVSFRDSPDDGFPEDYHTGLGSGVEAEVSDEGLQGTVTFVGLEPTFVDGGADIDAERLAGTASWDCTEG